MTVTINKKNIAQAISILEEKVKRGRKEGNLTKHFGKLKRGLDGLSYQITAREDEN